MRRGLAAYLPGRRVHDVEVRHDRAVRRHEAGAHDFGARLRGRTFTAVHRRGKYLWLSLDDGAVLLAHLGMSGQMLLPEAGSPSGPHLRVRLSLADSDRELRFVDQRTFGALAVQDLATGPDGVPVPSAIAHIAPDPFEPTVDDVDIVHRLRRRRSGVKRALLDQTLVSGIGNIYADEALWRARLHHERPGCRLSAAHGRDLLAEVRAVLAEAVAAGGTSFDALYVNVNGESGWFGTDLDVYGREGQACRRCGGRIAREPFMNRSSYTCPRCQRPPRRRRPAS